MTKDGNKASPEVWDMSQERAFIETIMGQRFHFTLIMFALAIGGAVSATDLLRLQIILGVGAGITAVLAISVYRAHRKLDIILRILFRNHKEHPATVVQNIARGTSVRWLIGGLVPFLCSGLLGVGFLLSVIGVIDPSACPLK